MRNFNIQLSKNFNFLEVINGLDLHKTGRKQNITFLTNLQEEEFQRIVRENMILAYIMQIARDHINDRFTHKNKGNPITILLICGGRTVNWDLSKNRSGEGGHPQWIAWDFVVGNVSASLRNEIMHYLYYTYFKSWMGGLGIRDNNGNITMIHKDTRPPRESDIARGFGRRWKY